MEADADSLKRAKRMTLYVVASATLATVAFLVTPAPSTVRFTATLIGAWLLFAALIRYAALHNQLPMPMFRRSIPIRFGGNLGRFTLRALGDGRRVEVRAGEDVVVEAVATDERDELIVHLEAVDDAELDALGAAIGMAIEMVAVADEDHFAEPQTVGPKSWEYRPSATSGGVLRTIGSRSH